MRLNKNVIILFILPIFVLFQISSCYKLLPPPDVPDYIGNPPVFNQNFYPENNIEVIGTEVEFSWDANDEDGDGIKYDFYFGTQENPPLFEEDASTYYFTISNLTPQTTYYWKVTANDGYNEISTKIRNFTVSLIGTEKEGGIVFYVDETGDHGLICSSDEITYNYYTSHDWGEYGENYDAYADGIGEGLQNTIKIVNSYSGNYHTAAEACYELILNDYSDWYLPSKTELLLIYENLKENNIGGLRSSNYWSSTEYNDYEAYSVDFNNGDIEDYSKNYNYYVRAVRQF